MLVSLQSDQTINTKKQKETKPSLSYEHPLWNEVFYFYVRDTKSITFNLEVARLYLQQRTSIYHGQFARTIAADVKEPTKISLEESGELDIVFEYHPSFLQYF